MSGIYFFSQDGFKTKPTSDSKIGIRGQRIQELVDSKMPIPPGFIIDSERVKSLDVKTINLILEYVKDISKITGRKLGDPEAPLFLKLVVSPDLRLVKFPGVRFIGINDETFELLKERVDEKFAYIAYCSFLEEMARFGAEYRPDIFTSLPEPDDLKTLSLDKLKERLKHDKEGIEKNIPSDLEERISYVLKQISAIAKINTDVDMGVLVQDMVLGNYSPSSFTGYFFTRNIVTGDPTIQGKAFIKDYFIRDDEGTGIDINTLDKETVDELHKYARLLEERYKEIRYVMVVREMGKVWVIEQDTVQNKSSQADIKLYMDLLKKGIIDEKFIIDRINPGHLVELLHKTIDIEWIKKNKVRYVSGGIAGSPGVATGRVFFSTERLMDEYNRALKMGLDNRLILVMPATYAEDVKAIEVGQGVLTTEGGYASHAPVVARSLGKVSLVNPKIKLNADSFEIDGIVVKEGDYITLEVPFYESPKIYFGEVKTVEPDFDRNGLMDVLKIVDKYIYPNFVVRANADQPREAMLSRKLGANGIGLCRTEHMFFDKERLPIFQELIISNSPEKRKEILSILKEFQKKDFMDLFVAMSGEPVTIRLLDAPLHEFLPHNDKELRELYEFLKSKKYKITLEELEEICNLKKEVNPMLGHRGVRVAITYPDIYEMQASAIAEAAVEVKKNGYEPIPEIMIPVVMNYRELSFAIYGKYMEGRRIRGIKEIVDEIISNSGLDIPVKYGSMIEIPSAALHSDKIAMFAEFISFGTNDLTQTTYGLSRDDISSFLPDYTEMDILDDNPFKVLGEEVGELIVIAVQRSRMVRPDMKIGLCGEHGADPRNIEFLKNVGLDYVSVAPYSIPLAKLAIAKINALKS
ncbi:MAG: PEP-utilizing enzyme [Brevinematales bacterium]|nr:PEP-utilizing enzyme [Brevinematales bacterium]